MKGKRLLLSWLEKICVLIILLTLADDLDAKDQEYEHFVYKVKLQSNVLNEEVNLFLYLPENYDNTDKLRPVLYLLDGNFFIYQAASIVQFLSDCAYIQHNLIPEFIIVGIESNDRNRDFTPTHTPVYEGMQFPTSGGAEVFYEFIENELIPFIENNYKASSHRVLAGWSLGGLFAIHAFLDHPDDFAAYLAVSPSLWWDNKVLVKRADSLLSDKFFSGKKLIVTLGKLERGDMPLSVKESFVPIMRKKSRQYAGFKFIEIEDEGHNTTPLLGLYSGLKSIYYSWSIPDYIMSGTIDAADAYILKLSNEYGYAGNDANEAYDHMIDIAVLQGRYNNALKIAEYLAARYPESSNTMFNLGIMHLRMEDNNAALTCFERAVEIEKASSNPNQEMLQMYQSYLNYVKKE